MIKCLHIFISGRVQGVCFRYASCHRAEALGLAGYARNLSDGRVEIAAEGGENELRDLLSWARQGPPGAQVTGVETRWEPGKKSFSSFSIR
ncbi:MAG: acylphosphatase [PVC group bacterium]